MVVCFELLVVNNWYEICDGFVAVAPWRFGWGAGSLVLVRIFFVSIYVLGVLVCLNIVIAFSIEAFELAMVSGSKQDHEDGLEGLDDALMRDVPTRQHSPSIIQAQRRLTAVVPVLSPDAERAKQLLKLSMITNLEGTTEEPRLQSRQASGDIELQNQKTRPARRRA